MNNEKKWVRLARYFAGVVCPGRETDRTLDIFDYSQPMSEVFQGIALTPELEVEKTGVPILSAK